MVLQYYIHFIENQLKRYSRKKSLSPLFSGMCNSTLCRYGLGWPRKGRVKMFRVLFLKAVYDLPTTKGLIENLKEIRVYVGFTVGNIEVKSRPKRHSSEHSRFLPQKVGDTIHATVMQKTSNLRKIKV